MDRIARRRIVAWLLIAIGLVDIAVATEAILLRNRALDLLIVPSCLLLLGISYFLRERWRTLSYVAIGVALVSSAAYFVILVQRHG